LRCWPYLRLRPCARRRGTGPPPRSQTLCVWAIVGRWRAGQSAAVRAGLVAPAIRTRLALADRTFAIALKTQRSHALADRFEIIGGTGRMRGHNRPMITLPASDSCPAARLTMLSSACASSFAVSSRPAWACDTGEIILDRWPGAAGTSFPRCGLERPVDFDGVARASAGPLPRSGGGVWRPKSCYVW